MRPADRVLWAILVVASVTAVAAMILLARYPQP